MVSAKVSFGSLLLIALTYSCKEQAPDNPGSPSPAAAASSGSDAGPGNPQLSQRIAPSPPVSPPVPAADHSAANASLPYSTYLQMPIIGSCTFVADHLCLESRGQTVDVVAKNKAAAAASCPSPNKWVLAQGCPRTTSMKGCYGPSPGAVGIYGGGFAYSGAPINCSDSQISVTH